MIKTNVLKRVTHILAGINQKLSYYENRADYLTCCSYLFCARALNNGALPEGESEIINQSFIAQSDKLISASQVTDQVQDFSLYRLKGALLEAAGLNYSLRAEDFEIPESIKHFFEDSVNSKKSRLDSPVQAFIIDSLKDIQNPDNKKNDKTPEYFKCLYILFMHTVMHQSFLKGISYFVSGLLRDFKKQTSSNASYFMKLLEKQALEFLDYLIMSNSFKEDSNLKNDISFERAFTVLNLFLDFFKMNPDTEKDIKQLFKRLLLNLCEQAKRIKSLKMAVNQPVIFQICIMIIEFYDMLFYENTNLKDLVFPLADLIESFELKSDIYIISARSCLKRKGNKEVFQFLDTAMNTASNFENPFLQTMLYLDAALIYYKAEKEHKFFDIMSAAREQLKKLDDPGSASWGFIVSAGIYARIGSSEHQINDFFKCISFESPCYDLIDIICSAGEDLYENKKIKSKKVYKSFASVILKFYEKINSLPEKLNSALRVMNFIFKADPACYEKLFLNLFESFDFCSSYKDETGTNQFDNNEARDSEENKKNREDFLTLCSCHLDICKSFFK